MSSNSAGFSARCNRRHGREQRLLHERALAGAAHAGDQAQHAQRKLDRDVLQVVAAGADQSSQPCVGRTTRAAVGADPSPREPFAGAALGMFEHLGRRALENHLAAELPGAGAHLDDMIGRLDQRRLVLDERDRIPAVRRGRAPLRPAAAGRPGAAPPTARRGRTACR